MARKRLIDIAVNIGDGMYKGKYHGKKYHEPDLEAVFDRAYAAGVEKMVAIAGSLKESIHYLKAAEAEEKRIGERRLFCTVGVHPTRCGEFEHNTTPEKHTEELRKVLHEGIEKGYVVGYGEIGLDYDRTQFCDIPTQTKYFKQQLHLAKEFNLPIIFHDRNTAGDFEKILEEHRDCFSLGVVHSFTGTVEEVKKLSDFGLAFGLNGCSFKTEDNLAAVAAIPRDRLILETDAPWCDIKRTHASFKYVKTIPEEKKKEKFVEGFGVKSRNEPAKVEQVLEVVAGHRSENEEELSEVIFENTIRFLPALS